MDDTPSVDELFPLPPGYSKKPGRRPTYTNLFTRLVANTTVEDEDNPNACWVWTGSTRRGYASINVREDGRHRTRSAHRVILEELGLSIPEGHEPDHLCYRRNCISPMHLWVRTRNENLSNRRGYAPCR